MIITSGMFSVEEIRVLPCLSLFEDDEVDCLKEWIEVRSCKKDEVLFSEQEPVRYVFIVRAGRIKLFKSSSDGKELVIRIMRAGDYFCCASVLSDGKHLVNGIAMEESEVLMIPSEFFKNRLFEGVNPVVKRIIKGLCGRIRYLSQLVEDITFMNVEGRILHLLDRVAKDSFEDGSDEVTLSFTHQDIAAMTGTVREVVSRVMSKLKKENVIVKSTLRGFTVNIKRLQEYKALLDSQLPR